MTAAQFLRPSAAHTWVVCHGYPLMRSYYPEAPDEADNDVREDGTACHWLANELWHGRQVTEGSLSPNHRVIDEDMFDAVDIYHSLLWSWIDGNQLQKKRIICEEPVPTSALFPDTLGMPDGTPDAYLFDAFTRTIMVGDLKYGFRFVEVWENWQLIIYALAIAFKHGIDAIEEQCWWVELYIVQPRSNHRDGSVRKWRVRLSDLRAHLNVLRAAASQAVLPEPACTPNPGCCDCPARHSCMALQNAALSALEQSYSGVPLELDAPAVGDELRRLVAAQKYMEARITGLQTQAEHMLQSGTVVPHWQLAPTFARERWQDGVEHLVITMGQYYGADLAKPARAITPNQARKAGMPESVVSGFAHRPSTGVRLTPIDKYEARKKFGENQ